MRIRPSEDNQATRRWQAGPPSAYVAAIDWLYEAANRDEAANFLSNCAPETFSADAARSVTVGGVTGLLLLGLMI